MSETPTPQANITAASLQPELWTASSNEALQIFITDTKGAAKPFQPNFTYPIFGDSESIFGFKDLVIFLCFDSVTFLPFLNVKFSDKLDDKDIEMDPKTKLLEYLPESTVFKDEAKWRDQIDEEQKDFLIPGDLVGEVFEKNGEKYGIYNVDLKNASGLELHKRLQILILLFIEAGSYIDAGDHLWDVYVLYRVTDEKLPEVIGFCTAYNYWKYPGAVKFDAGNEEVRKKISQFIILPTDQGQHLGGEFYDRLYNTWLQDDKIVEVVIEDPNESFDDLRDRVDIKRVVNQRQVLSLSDLTVEAAGDSEWYSKVRLAEKLEKRQFSRLLEMFFLYKLKNFSQFENGGLTKKQVRLFIKERLYEKNKEALLGLDEPTRIDKLQTAYDALEQDYYRILEPVKLGAKRPADGQKNGPKRVKK